MELLREPIIGLVGVLVGGGITFFVEWFMHKRRNTENLKIKIGELLLDLVLIQSDWTHISETVESAKDALSRHKPGTDLWQTIYRFHWRPSLPQLDINAKLGPMLSLRSRALMEDAGWVLSNYGTMTGYIEAYNSLMERYEAHMAPHTYIKDGQRFFRGIQDDAIENTLRANLIQHSRFIATEITVHVAKIEECQKELYRAAEQHFGSADFLRLPPRKPG